jgi:hypothetical protein
MIGDRTYGMRAVDGGADEGVSAPGSGWREWMAGVDGENSGRWMMGMMMRRRLTSGGFPPDNGRDDARGYFFSDDGWEHGGGYGSGGGV